MPKDLSTETRDRISKSMEGNTNAAGNTHRKSPGRVYDTDHKKILKRFTKRCKKESYFRPVAKSAAYLMFMEASHDDQVRLMRKVRKVLKYE